MSKIKVTFVETNCKKNGPIKQTLNIIRNMDKETFEPSLVTVWPEDTDNSMIDEYKKLGIPVLSANMSKKKSVLFGKKAVGQLLEQLQPDIVQGVGMPPYRMTLGYKKAIHFVTLRNYCYEDYPDYYGKIPGTVMAFLDLNLIKKRMVAGEPFVTCSESLTKMYRSRQNMEIPYIRNGVDVSQYTKRSCDEIEDVRKKLDLPLEKTIYVYSGGFIDRKNQREAITAFLAMKKNVDAALLLLGDKAINFVFLIALPMMLYFIIFAKEGIFFLSGDAYGNAVLPMQIIMPTLIFIGLTNVMGIQMLVPLGREKIVLYSEIAGAVVDLIINFILIPRFASAGAAIGTLIAEIVVWIVQFGALKNEIVPAYRKIQYPQMVVALAVGCAASAWVKMLGWNSFFTLMLSAILFFGSYGLVLILTHEPLVLEIVNQIFGKVKKFIKK